MKSLSLALLVAMCCFCLPLQAEDWTQFRGSDANGQAAGAAPLKWSEESTNLRWKIPLAGPGWSAPVVQGERLWLTLATREGASLRAACFATQTGKQLLDVEVFAQDDPGKIHAKNRHASPTPILHGGFVYVHFGAFGTACLTEAGEIVWQRKLPYRQVHGPGGSPALHNGKLFINCDGGDRQYVVALSAKTGEIVWQTDRSVNPYAKKFAFSTPVVTQFAGVTQVVSAGAGGISSYHPDSGKELWRVDYPEGYSVVPQPAVGNDMVFVSSAFDRPSLLAIRPQGSGNLTESGVIWTAEKGAPNTPSPLLVGKELYLVSDRGVATCLDAQSGEQLWQERLGGNFSASPLFAQDRIYFLNETGEMTVVAAGREFQELAKNAIDGATLATPAIVNGSLYLRTDTHLYRFDSE